MKLSAKTLFLIDATGALATALLLSQVLARFESVFGMPGHVLLSLAAIALCFLIYSTTCYFFVDKYPARFLKVIAAANALYCILTLGLMMMHTSTLTMLGYAYFIGEIMIILTLVRFEFRTLGEHL
jgi:hypothetical protein